MKTGDFLVAKQTCSIDIRCGDGVVGSFNMIKGNKYFITNVYKDSVAIEYTDFNTKKTHTIWFLTGDNDDYFLEYYERYFYNFITSNRKEKCLNLKKAIK